MNVGDLVRTLTDPSQIIYLIIEEERGSPASGPYRNKNISVYTCIVAQPGLSAASWKYWDYQLEVVHEGG